MPTIADGFRQLAARAFHLVRSGPRVVLWTPPNLGVGNHLYMWLWTHRQRQQGVDAWVLQDARMSAWLTEFPVLRELTIRRDEVKFRDRRTIEWAQAWGHHYSGDELRSFAALLMSQEPFARRVSAVRDQFAGTTLAVNVRRGDYYSVPEHRARYGMNVVGWVGHALPLALESSTIDRIQVVSDDLAWCARELGWLAKHRPTSFERIGEGAEGDLAMLTAADALVLTNSTFSYWGGHLNGARRGGADHAILAPAFHARGQSPGDRSWHLDPAWHTVEDIPGGWADA